MSTAPPEGVPLVDLTGMKHGLEDGEDTATETARRLRQHAATMRTWAADLDRLADQTQAAATTLRALNGVLAGD